MFAFLKRKNKLPSDFRVSLRPDITVTHFEDRVVLFSKSAGEHFGLNSTAYEMLKKLSANSDATSVAREVATTYEVSPEMVLNDLRELVRDLNQHKLITVLPVKELSSQ